MSVPKKDDYGRGQKRNTSCALFVSLLPFFLAAALYFYLWTPESPPSIVAAGVKVAPILLLAAVVLSWNGGQSLVMVGGLLFSAVGDCCLIWNGFILQVSGIGAFAVAHLLYSVSFLSSRYGPHSSSSWIRGVYLILIMVGGGFYLYLYQFLQKAPHSDVLTPAVGVYFCLILLMVCLGIRTRHTVTALGGLSFAVSDSSLALQTVKVLPQIGGHLVVMVTYYMAQLLIAVGDVKAAEDDLSKRKRS
ncbi:lysoplasmalogenase-like [Mugil cephalus]|uniref:lysoplasmalogenase-like n=1 Tax=Mugil cephalus TaxID=48193 RepID=UPI001FB6361F|nr:lysoplasmalogenase-like [Mugil cephalus]